MKKTEHIKIIAKSSTSRKKVSLSCQTNGTHTQHASLFAWINFLSLSLSLFLNFRTTSQIFASRFDLARPQHVHCTNTHVMFHIRQSSIIHSRNSCLTIHCKAYTVYTVYCTVDYSQLLVVFQFQFEVSIFSILLNSTLLIQLNRT